MCRLHGKKLGQQIMWYLFLIVIKAITVYPGLGLGIQPTSVRLQEPRKGEQRSWLVQTGKGLISLGSFHDPEECGLLTQAVSQLSGLTASPCGWAPTRAKHHPSP